MIFDENDLGVLDECWGPLFQVLDDRREQLGPVGEVDQAPMQVEAGLIAFAIEHYQFRWEGRGTSLEAFIHLVQLTWEALERQQHEPLEERNRRKRDYRRWEREEAEAFRASPAEYYATRGTQAPPPGYAPVPVRWEDLPSHATSAARVA